MAWDFSVIDLTDWKVTLPVDADYFEDDGGDGNSYDDKAFEVKGDDFEGFEAEEFFYYDEDEGAIVFRADVDGALTSSSTKYTRSELREMDGDDNAAWTVDEGGTLSATLKVTELATEDDGGVARVIVGQIHGEDDELTRLYYNADGELYYANEITGDDGDERLFYFEDENGNRPNVDLGETFSYIIDVHDGKLTVAIYAGDTVYMAVPTDGVDPSEIVDAWSDDTFYFKAGVYQGVTYVDDHAHEGSGAAEAAFYAIDFGHEDGEGLGGWPPAGGGVVDPVDPPVDIVDPVDPPVDPVDPVDPPVDPVDPPTVEGLDGDSNDNTLIGTDADETAKGRGGDDVINGMGGDDILWGNAGNDTLIGGAGADWLKGGNGADTYVLDDASAVDTIADFSIPNGDKIDLSIMLDGQPGFTQDGALDDGFISLTQSGSDTLLYVQLGDTLTHVATLSDEDASGISLSDFILPDDTPDVTPPVTPPSEETPDGDSGDNTLVGTTDGETIKGRGGDDTIYGMDGDDELWGNDGDDVLVGGEGADWLKGGDGTDVFVFDDAGSVDTVADFSTSNGDKIDLSGLLDGQAGFKQATAFEDGFVVLEQSGSDTEVFVRLDGTLVQVATLEDESADGLSQSDFILPGDSTQSAPSDFEVFIADATSNEILTQVSNGDAIDASLLAGRDLTIVVRSELDGLDSIQMTWDDHVQIESHVPYALFGDASGDYNGGGGIDAGDHSLSLAAYDENRAAGDLLAIETLNFTVA